MTDIAHLSGGPVTVRAARWSARHPWRAIALWLVFVASCIAIGQAAGLRTITDLDTGVGQSGHAARVLHTAHLDTPATEDVLVSARAGALDQGAARAAAAGVTGRMRTLPEVASVAAPVLSKNGTAVLVVVTMSGDPNTATDRIAPLLDATASTQRDYPGLRVEEVGGASLNKGVNDQVNKDLGMAAEYSLPVTLVILLIAFGATIAAGVPVLLALSAVGAATGLAALASQVLPDSGTTSSMILLMGMAVGVDYSLFYVKRVREERARGRAHLDAIEVAAQTSGHSVIVSGVAVIVAMLGLFVARDAVFSSLAAGSIIVVAVAVLGSLTVLPAVLAKLGRRVDRRSRRSRPAREPRVWPALLRPSMRYPGRTLAVSVLLLLALAAPALGLRLHSDSPDALPRVIPITHTFDRLTAAFPAEQSNQQIVVRAPAVEAGAVRAQLEALRGKLSTDPLFAVTSAPVQVSVDATVHVLDVDIPYDAESAQARSALHKLRSELLPKALATVPGVDWAVGGDTANAVDYDAHLSAAMPWVVAFVVVMTMLMMAVVFRSLVLALVTAFVNLLSAGAAFGVLALTFQHRWAQGLLDFHSTGTVVTWIPLFTFAVLFGLSMDYHVFVVSRIREAAGTGLSPREAVRAGILRSAATVTSAAIVMVSVFSIFASLHMVEMKELGVGLATAVLIDAVLVRAVVLPSLLVLLGRWVPWTRPSVRVPVTTAARPVGLAPSQLRWRNPLALLFSPAPWACAAYLLSSLVVGAVWFSIALTVLLICGVLSVFWIGLPLLLAAFALLRACAGVERGRARLLGIRLRPAYRRAQGSGLRCALRARVGDRARWGDVVALVVLWPVLFVLDLSAILVWSIPLGLISVPFWYRTASNTWFIDSMQAALSCAGIGLALLLVMSNYVIVGAARAHVRLIAPRLAPPVRALESSRPHLDRSLEMSHPRDTAVEDEFAELMDDRASRRMNVAVEQR